MTCMGMLPLLLLAPRTVPRASQLLTLVLKNKTITDVQGQALRANGDDLCFRLLSHMPSSANNPNSLNQLLQLESLNRVLFCRKKIAFASRSCSFLGSLDS